MNDKKPCIPTPEDAQGYKEVLEKMLTPLQDEVNNLPGSIPMLGEPQSYDNDNLFVPDVPLWETDELFLNPFVELPPIQSWCKIGERNAIPKKGLITFSAKTKQGKSYSIYALLLSLVSGEQLDTITPTGEPPRLIIVFDTEMSKTSLTNRVRNMQNALGDKGISFAVISLLQYGNDRRKEIIETTIKKYNPDVVAIDVLTRLIRDFNNVAECNDFANWLQPIAANRTVLTVIHQNKASDNTQMKGHLGSIMNELAVENYDVRRNKGIITAKPTNARDTDVDEETPGFCFIVDKERFIISATEKLEQQREVNREKWYRLFKEAFGNTKTMSRTNLEKAVVNLRGLKPTAASENVRNAIKFNVIEKVGKGRFDPYRLVNIYSDVSDDDL